MPHTRLRSHIKKIDYACFLIQCGTIADKSWLVPASSFLLHVINILNERVAENDACNPHDFT